MISILLASRNCLDEMNAKHTSERSRRELVDRVGGILFYGTFGLLLFGPLVFGAVEPWSIFVVEAGSAGLLLFWVAKQALENRIAIRPNPLFVPMGMFGVLIACQLIFRISAYPHATMSSALLFAAYGSLCFLASQTLLRTSQARRLATIFCIYGAALASFALIQGIASNGKLYWLRQPRMGGWIYGPYVNHNHYAGLMEMLVPIPLVLSLSHLASARSRNLAAAAAAVMVGTIFLCGSRGGMLAISVELLILATFVIRQKLRTRATIGAVLFLTIVVGLLTWIGGGDLTRRIASVGPSSDITSDVRANINRDTFRMFLKNPISGWGLGNFPVVYPQFRTFYTDFFVNEAHNDYLQLLAETGLLGFAIVACFITIACKKAFTKSRNWSSELSGAMALACLLGLSGILVHSAVDFNLQIPANAALFYVLCTVAASQPLIKPAHRHRTLHSNPPVEIVSAAPLEELTQF